MSKTILAQVDGFTPVINTIVDDLGLMSAVVFGRVWRFCQMEDGVCKASLEKISKEIGVDKATVMRHIKTLCEAGYLKDLTPNVRNQPHIYVDTGKAGLSIGITATVAESNSSEKSVAESKLKIEEEGNVFKAFEENISPLTSMLAESLGDLIDEHSPKWVIAAIKEAAENGKRNLKYIAAILRRWKADGYGTPHPKSGQERGAGESFDDLLKRKGYA